MIRNIVRRHFTTIKSMQDEQINKSLVDRLRSVPKLKQEDRRFDKPPPTENKEIQSLRKLTLSNLLDIVSKYTEDPLIWNPHILGKIYKLPEPVTQAVCHNVCPQTYYFTYKSDEPEVILKPAAVIDIARFKTDHRYHRRLKKLVFHDGEEPARVINLDLEDT